MSQRPVFETPWFKVETVDPDPLSDDQRPYYRVVEPDGILVFVLTAAGAAVLVRQYRPALARHTLEFPAGAIDPGEDMVTAARREVEEETGFRAGAIGFLGKARLKTNRFSSTDHFSVTIATEQIERWAPGSRATEALVLPRPELVDLIRRGEFEQGSALGVITLARVRWGIDLLTEPMETITRVVEAHREPVA